MSQTPVDSFARDNLPPCEQWPEIDLSHPAYHYPDRLNCVTRFVDYWVEAGKGDRTALMTPERHALLRTGCRAGEPAWRMCWWTIFGMIPGNRVLLRSANTPMMVIAYLAVIRAGGIAVGTMPLLRAKELSIIADKAQISLALCDERLGEEMSASLEAAPVHCKRIGWFGSDRRRRARGHDAGQALNIRAV